jgi:hypothetical protein
VEVLQLLPLPLLLALLRLLLALLLVPLLPLWVVQPIPDQAQVLVKLRRMLEPLLQMLLCVDVEAQVLVKLRHIDSSNTKTHNGRLQPLKPEQHGRPRLRAKLLRT